MTNPQKKQQIIILKQAGKTYHEIKAELLVSISFIYTTLHGKSYKQAEKANRAWVRGITDNEKIILKNIAKNRDKTVNRVLLSYIRAGINAEPRQNHTYED